MAAASLREQFAAESDLTRKQITALEARAGAASAERNALLTKARSVSFLLKPLLFTWTS